MKHSTSRLTNTDLITRISSPYFNVANKLLALEELQRRLINIETALKKELRA